MHKASEVLTSGTWNPTQATDHITLTYDERHRRRFRYTAHNGTDFLLDLPRATVLNAGDALQLDTGALIEVLAADEPLTEVRAATPEALVRLAWHIGNRHLPAQLDADRILIREDHVIVAMLQGLGAQVRSLLAPFTPESGAYANAHSHAQQNDHAYVFVGSAHGH